MNFKTILFSCALLPALAFHGYAQEKTTLDIRLKGLKKGEAIYIFQKDGSNPVKDTLIARRDNRATGTISVPYTGNGVLFYLPAGKSMKDLPGSATREICIHPGDRLRITGDLATPLSKAQISGGLYDNLRYKGYFDGIGRLEAEAFVYSDSLLVMEQTIKGLSDEKQKDELMKKLRTMNDKCWAVVDKMYVYMDDFVRRYPSDVFSAYVLSNIKGSYAQKNREKLFNLLTPEVRNTPVGKEIQANISMSNAWEKANKNIKAESQAPDFTLTDIDGQKVSLSGLRGKYVVLDFWGSWCGPCRNANPHMVKLYDRYKDRPDFAMISLALDQDDAAWRKAVKEDGLTWTQVNMCETPQSASSVNVLYGVSLYPSQMLISPEGKILVRQNGFNPDNDTVSAKLEEIFAGQ